VFPASKKEHVSPRKATFRGLTSNLAGIESVRLLEIFQDSRQLELRPVNVFFYWSGKGWTNQ
jgi:hypothetical protein